MIERFGQPTVDIDEMIRDICLDVKKQSGKT
jgi:hypothetical protein